MPSSPASPANFPVGLARHLLTDRDALDRASGDFGSIVGHRPAGVLRPKTATDLARFVNLAAASGFRLVPRGEGHSTGGQAQSDAGIVVELAGLNTVGNVDGDRVSVAAGARWSDVLAATLPHGLAPAVLTDYLGLSVGGTLSAGGVGGATNHHGLQTDNVLELDVVTPGGELVTCSPAERPALFDAVRGGWGDSGVIARAAIRLFPVPPRVRRHQLRYRDLRTFVAEQRRLALAGCCEQLKGQAKWTEAGWEYLVEAVVDARVEDPGAILADAVPLDSASADLDFAEFAHWMDPGVALLRELGEWHQPHPWLALFLPDSTTAGFLGELMSRITVADIGDYGRLLLYPFRTDRVNTPRIRLSSEPLTYLVALLRTAPPRRPEVVRRMLADNARLASLARTSGGYVYLGG